MHNYLKSNQRIKKSKNIKWEIISYTLCYVSTLLVLVLLAFPVFSVLVNIDQYFNILYDVFNSHVNPLVLFAIRILLLTLYYIQACSLYSMYLALLFYLLELQEKCVQSLDFVFISNDKFISTYVALQIVNKTWENILSDWAFLLLSILFWLLSVSAIAVVKYRLEIPILVSWFLISTVVVDGVVLAWVFLFLTKGFEVTSAILLERQKRAGRRRCFIRRKLEALRPISVHFGGSFQIGRNCQS